MIGSLGQDSPNPLLFNEFWQKIEKQFGLRYSTTRYPAITQQVVDRATTAGCSTADEYLKKFASDSFNAREYEFWANALTVNETYFMRTTSDWKALRHSILPNVIQARRLTKNIKIVSLGCASGEELYSIALVIAQWFPELLDWQLQLIGGDIDTVLLDIARDGGPYSERSIRLLDPRVRDEYLFQHNGQWYVRDSIKTLAYFRYFNIIKSVDPLLTRDIDILFCRNVLIYFDTPTAIQCVRKCVNALSADGTLILGSSEGFLADEAGHPARITDGSFLVQRTQAAFDRYDVRGASGCSDQARRDDSPMEQLNGVSERPGAQWQSTEQLLDESRSLIDRGKLDVARRKLGTLILRQHSSYRGHYLLGIVYEHIGALDDARKEFEEVISIAPEFCMAYLQSVLVHKRMGLHDMAFTRLLALFQLLDAHKDEDVVDEEQQLTVGFLRMTCQNLCFDLEQAHGHA
jgi:chemotaxis methyl-accepting protein methylase